MKIKQHLVITDPERFLRGDYDGCFSLYTGDPGITGWIGCGEITITVNPDIVAMTNMVIEKIDQRIDEEEKEYNSKMLILKARKDELLALPFIPEEVTL